MEMVQRFLEESEEKAITRKKVQKSIYAKIQLERTKADVSMIEKEVQFEQNISLKRAELDKMEGKELSQAAKRIEKEQSAQLKKALSDQQALFERMIAHERAIAKEVLQKTLEENDQSRKKERETIDSLNNQARALVEELENDRARLKGLIENMIPLIEQNEVQVPDGMICMPRIYFDIAVNNDCRPGLAMQFKLFKLDELYPDLQKYDLRASLRDVGIHGDVVYADFVRAMFYHGYIYDAEVYYLNPAPRSEPPTDLVKIEGPDDVNKMVRAHTEQGTKICLLYLVSKHEDQNPDEYMEPYIPFQSEEEAVETSNANVLPGI